MNVKVNANAKSRTRLWMALGGLVIVALIIAAFFAGQSQGSPSSIPNAGANASGADEEIDLARRLEDDPTAMGALDAPVVLIEFADYRCPFCSVFARETMPDLVKEYVESGQLRIEWRDLPIFGEQSVQTAVAGRAAGEQGKFWEFHAAVADAAPERGHAEIDRAALLEFARIAGVEDLAQFEKDLDDPALLKLVEADAAEARSYGLSSTPMFVINDTAIAGAQPIEVFRDAIDAKLEEAGH